MTVRLQPLTRAKVASLGDVGAAWVASLPQTLDALSRAWGLTLGRPLPGGSASYVVAARTVTGESRVLKVAIPDRALVGEARVLAAARGQGYARLHAHDPDRHALLLESLGRSLEQTPMPVEAKLAALVDTLQEAWRVPLSTVPEAPPGDDRASVLRRLVLELDTRLGHPTRPNVLARACEYAERRAAAHDPGRCVVAHGDPHPANLLRRPHAGWALVDPEGVRADPTYDLGVALRDWTGQLAGDARAVLDGYCDLLADSSGLDRQAIWEWGFLERVSTGLYVCSFGAHTVGRRFLDSAEALV
ncbi:MAG: aminoglycoside phosphotransferase family protein [Nocardioides sp.]|nr:aminoglycoside phosphotransferase family protein [Nocardioides sp.]